MSAIKRSLVVGFVAVALGWFGMAAAADDRAICIGPDVPNDSRTEACTRAIAPGRLSGHDLALASAAREEARFALDDTAEV